MGNYFFDSSALVKRYIAEAGSTWVGDLTHRAHGNRCYLSNIAGAEVSYPPISNLIPPQSPRD